MRLFLFALVVSWRRPAAEGELVTVLSYQPRAGLRSVTPSNGRAPALVKERENDAIVEMFYAHVTMNVRPRRELYSLTLRFADST